MGRTESNGGLGGAATQLKLNYMCVCVYLKLHEMIEANFLSIAILLIDKSMTKVLVEVRVADPSFL